MTEHLPDYLALREANDRLRQAGIEAIWNTLTLITTRVNDAGPVEAGEHPLQLGRQPGEFMVEQATMVGERLGLRYNFRTLIFELGWPRLPEHGYITGNGLARGRVGFSQNAMLDPRPLASLILKRDPQGAPPRWHLIEADRAGAPLHEQHFREYLALLEIPHRLP
jgi:hypothetical protein